MKKVDSIQDEMGNFSKVESIRKKNEKARNKQKTVTKIRNAFNMFMPNIAN